MDKPKMPELPDVLKGWLSTAQKEMVFDYARQYAADKLAQVEAERDALKVELAAAKNRARNMLKPKHRAKYDAAREGERRED